MKERLVSPQLSEEEQIIEGSLRPRRLAEYIGQEKIKDNLSILLEAARRRRRHPALPLNTRATWLLS